MSEEEKPKKDTGYIERKGILQRIFGIRIGRKGESMAIQTDEGRYQKVGKKTFKSEVKKGRLHIKETDEKLVGLKDADED